MMYSDTLLVLALPVSFDHKGVSVCKLGILGASLLTSIAEFCMLQSSSFHIWYFDCLSEPVVCFISCTVRWIHIELLLFFFFKPHWCHQPNGKWLQSFSLNCSHFSCWTFKKRNFPIHSLSDSHSESLIDTSSWNHKPLILTFCSVCSGERLLYWCPLLLRSGSRQDKGGTPHVVVFLWVPVIDTSIFFWYVCRSVFLRSRYYEYAIVLKCYT